MAKTIPQMLKIERRDDEHVAREPVEPYAWQRKKTPPVPDPFATRTVPERPTRTIPDGRRRGR